MQPYEEQKFEDYEVRSPAFGETSDRRRQVEDVLADVEEIREPDPLDEEPLDLYTVPNDGNDP